jgi:hypothetical protein
MFEPALGNMDDVLREEAGCCGLVLANTIPSGRACSMKITEAIRKCAAEQGVVEEKALKRGMEEKSRELTEKGSELYAEA